MQLQFRLHLQCYIVIFYTKKIKKDKSNIQTIRQCQMASYFHRTKGFLNLIQMYATYGRIYLLQLIYLSMKVLLMFCHY